jgi:hypothetical protein
MIQENPQRGLESVMALALAFEGNRDKKLTDQESAKNLCDNLVNVCGFKGIESILANGLINFKLKGIGSGLRITTDGWTLTAYHNIEKYVDDWKRIAKEEPPTDTNVLSWLYDMKHKYAIIDQKKDVHPIDPTVCIFRSDFDIALIKAVIFEEPKPIRFKVASKDLAAGDEIQVFGLINQEQCNSSGRVIIPRREIQLKDFIAGEVISIVSDVFLTDAYGRRGYSGGVFTTAKGEFVGMPLHIQRAGKEEVGLTGGANVKNVKELVKEMVYALGKK